MDDALKEKLRELVDANVPIRRMREVLDGARGSSSSNAARFLEEDAERALAFLNNRRFDDVPIVAAQFDGTWIGTRGKKRLVLIAIGVTAEGHRVTLGARIAESESEEAILKMLEDIRGVDRRILWTSDRGLGFRAALKTLTGSKTPSLQLCTTHVAGNVVAKFDEEEKERVRKELYKAWWHDDPDQALKDLGSIADKLEEQGDRASRAGMSKEAEAYVAAAATLRDAMENTVTVQRLGLVRSLRRQLRSTNRQEGTNGQLKGSGFIAYVTKWKDDPMLLAKVAWKLLRLEATSWTRMPEAEQLVDLMERLLPDGFDAEAIRRGLPPTLIVERLPVVPGDDERMRELAERADRWCADHPDAVPIGSTSALDALGLRGATVTPEVLLDALQGLPPDRQKSLRQAADITVAGVDDKGDPVEEKVRGIYDLRWELIASPTVMREWHKGGAAQEKAEAKLMEAATAAMEQLTFTTAPNHGFAAVAALRRPIGEDPDQLLRVSGITFATKRGKDAALTSPATKGIRASQNLRAAEDVAKAVLDEAFKEMTASEAATEPGVPADDHAESAPAGPELVAAMKTRALELAPRMVAKKPVELEELSARMVAAFEGLDVVDGEVRQWKKEHWEGAVRQIAAAGGRPQPGSDPRGGVWSAITRGQRAVLGDTDARLLLEGAIHRFGKAETDPQEARELQKGGEDALAGLRGPIARVGMAAEALAAGRELLRRIERDAVREPDAREPAPAPALRDSRGVLAADPIDQRASGLGRHRRMALKRFASSLAPEMRKLDDGALRRLAARHASLWEKVDPTVGTRLAGLENRRDSIFGKRLKAVREVGREDGSRQKAEREKKGRQFIEADKRREVVVEKARGLRGELRAAEEEMAELRGSDGSPTVLVVDHPEVAIHDAAFAELSRREREKERTPAREAAEEVRSIESIGAGL